MFNSALDQNLLGGLVLDTKESRMEFNEYVII